MVKLIRPQRPKRQPDATELDPPPIADHHPKSVSAKIRLALRPLLKLGSIKRKASESDILVAVMGMTGAGKSSFIATATGRKDVQVGHGLDSATSEIRSYRMSHGSRNYVLVDTPGFDDSRMSNTAVTQSIVQWLEFSCCEGTRLSGIIYIHNISKARMQGSAHSNIRMFRKLIRDKALNNVLLATSFWDQIIPSVGAARERQLTESSDFWAEMVAQGSEVVRLNAGRSQYLELLEQIAAKSSAGTLRPEKTLVRKNRSKAAVASQASPADRIADFEDRLAKEKKAEKKGVQRNLKKRQKVHEKDMRKLRREMAQRRWKARWDRFRSETRHRLQLMAERSQMDRDMRQVVSPLRRAESEQAARERRTRRLERELHSYEYYST